MQHHSLCSGAVDCARGLLGVFLILIAGVLWTGSTSAHQIFYWGVKVSCSVQGGWWGGGTINISNFESVPVGGTLLDWHDPLLEYSYCTCDYESGGEILSSSCSYYDDYPYYSYTSIPVPISDTGDAVGYLMSGLSIKLVKLKDQLAGSGYFYIPNLTGWGVGTGYGYGSVTICDHDDQGNWVPWCEATHSFSATDTIQLNAYYYNYRIVLAPTCTTPTVPNQVLLPAKVNEFGGVGSSVGQHDFSLQFVNCTNLSKILYKIDPVGTAPHPGLGVLPPRLPQSTSEGVAIQILEQDLSNNYVASVFDQWRERTHSGANYTLNFRARYFQLQNDLIPGSIESAMTITIQYQ